MLTKSLFCLCVLLFTGESTPAFADWTRLPSSEFPMKAFPAEGSAAFERDFEKLHEYQDSDREDKCKIARRQEHPDYQDMFGDEESPLTEAEVNKAEVLVTKVMKLALKVSNFHKAKFLRPRPYDTDDTIKPCTKKPGGEKSYPSSHSATSMAGACVLAEIFPDKAKKILAYGESLGELRAIVGVHHPSDVAAGQKLGNDVCARVQEEEDFQRELKKLRKD